MAGFGNQALQRMLQARVIQAKLTVNAPGDAYEQEADRIADRVMRMPDPARPAGTTEPKGVQRACAKCEEELQRAPLGIQRVCATCEEELHRSPAPVQRKCASCALDGERDGTEADEAAPSIQRKCSACEEELQRAKDEDRDMARVEGDDGTRLTLIQRAEASPDPTPAARTDGRTPAGEGDARGVPASVRAGIESGRGGGHPLPDDLRAFMEPRIGADFSAVRFHRGPTASRLSKQVQAKAFTFGRDVFFHDRHYDPASFEGRRLIAHELVHTVQQGAAPRRSHRYPPSVATSQAQISRTSAETVQRIEWDPSCVPMMVPESEPVCDPPPGVTGKRKWTAKAGTVIGDEIEKRFVAQNSDAYAQVPIPGASKSPLTDYGDLVPRGAWGKADLLRVTRRTSDAVYVQVAEIKPLKMFYMGQAAIEAAHYVDKLEQNGDRCAGPKRQRTRMCTLLKAHGKRIVPDAFPYFTPDTHSFNFSHPHLKYPRRIGVFGCAPGIAAYRCLEVDGEDDDRKKKKKGGDGDADGKKKKKAPDADAPKKKPKVDLPEGRAVREGAEELGERAAGKGLKKLLLAPLPGDEIVQATMFATLLLSGAKPAFGMEGEDVESAFLDLLLNGPPPDVDVPPGLQKLLDEADPELLARIREGAATGEVSDEDMDAIARETFRLLDENKDLLDDETLRTLAVAMEQGGGIHQMPVSEDFRQQLETIKKRGDGRQTGAGGSEGEAGGETKKEGTVPEPPAPAKGKPGDAPPEPEANEAVRKAIEEAGPRSRRIVEGLMTKEGEGSVVTVEAVRKVIAVTRGLTDDQVDALLSMVQPVGAGQSLDQFLAELGKAVEQVRREHPPEPLPSPDPKELHAGLDFTGMAVGDPRIVVPNLKDITSGSTSGVYMERVLAPDRSTVDLAAAISLEITSNDGKVVEFVITGASEAVDSTGRWTAPTHGIVGRPKRAAILE